MKFCPNCEIERPTLKAKQQETYKLYGQEITISVDREICATCGEPIGSESDQETISRITNLAKEAK